MAGSGGFERKRMNECHSEHGFMHEQPRLQGSNLEEILATFEQEVEAELFAQGQKAANTNVNLLSTSQVPEDLTCARARRTPRTISRTRGSPLVPSPAALSSLVQSMTFSDAEEDHPEQRSQGRCRQNPSGSSSSSTQAMDQPSQPQDQQQQQQQQSSSSPHRARTESGMSNISNASTASTAPMAASGAASAPSATGSSASAAASASGPKEENNRLASEKVMDKAHIVHKLHQIQEYIRQTKSAMDLLEREGDVNCRTNLYLQYETLNKTLKEQEEDYLNILGRMLVLNKQNEMAASGAAGGTGTTATASGTGRVSDEPEAISGANGEASVAQDTAAEGTERQQVTGGGSTVEGVVGSDEPPQTMQDRLARAQVDQESVMAKLRDSLQKRQDLITRYKATRERLANLKQQRNELAQQQNAEERHFLQAEGAPRDPYVDPIPEAETWNLEQINSSITDFKGLMDKVMRLQTLYAAKAEHLVNEGSSTSPAHYPGQKQCNKTEETVDPDDVIEMRAIRDKMEQLLEKKRELDGALAQLHRLKQLKEVEEGVPTVLEEIAVSSRISNIIPISTAQNPEEGMATSQEVSRRGEAAEGGPVTSGISDLMEKHEQLKELKDQLTQMKGLLDANANAREMAIQNQSSRNVSEPGPSTRHPGHRARESNEAGAVGHVYIGLNGKEIHISEEEQKNPAVAEKYNQLCHAKSQLARMEQIMARIKQASDEGKPIHEVLSADDMAMLEEAEDEEQVEERERRSPPRPYHRASKVGSTSHGDSSAPANYSLAHDQHRQQELRAQEQRELCAMRQHLNKNTTVFSEVNEGRQSGREKGAIKKQPQAMFSRESLEDSEQRLAEVIAMQEELRQKKNALEALVQRMGKPSAPHMDNLSDNVSEPVIAGAGMYSGVDSDDEMVEEEDAALPSYHHRSHHRKQASATVLKDRNRQMAANLRSKSRGIDSHVSINNLASGHGVRPKHNRNRGSSLPKASWESYPPPHHAAGGMGSNGSERRGSQKSSSNFSVQAQQAINAAISQLNQVQETIGGIYEALRTEQGQLPASNMAPFLAGRLQPLQQQVQSLQQQVQPLSSMSGLSSYQQQMQPLHSPSMSSLTPLNNFIPFGNVPSADGNMNQLMNGLNQCFNQLYVHSMEIHALSKHLQLLSDGAASPVWTDSGGIGRAEEGMSFSEEGRNRNLFAHEESVPSVPPPPSRQNLFPPKCMDPMLRIPQSFSFPGFPSAGPPCPATPSAPPPCPSTPSAPPHAQPPHGDVGLDYSGVSNPIYGRLSDHYSGQNQSPYQQVTSHLTSSDLRDLQGESQYRSRSHSPLFDTVGCNPIERDGNPLSSLGENSGLTQAQQITDHWASLHSSSLRPPHPATTDVLNNQIPPGTRANNYWDNFRSYSRQNLLSSTKSNAGDSRVSSSSKIQQQTKRSSSSDNRLNWPNHENNTSRGGGARARVSNATSQPPEVRGQNKPKYNNRRNQGPSPSRDAMGNQCGYTSNNSLHAPLNCDPLHLNTRQGLEVQDAVLTEAQYLIHHHANQPEFLLQLFRNASRLTADQDRDRALTMLNDVVSSRSSRNRSYSQNECNSSQERNNARSYSLPAPLIDSTRRRNVNSQSSHNILPQNDPDQVSASDLSDSGLTSEDEDSRDSEKGTQERLRTSTSATRSSSSAKSQNVQQQQTILENHSNLNGDIETGQDTPQGPYVENLVFIIMNVASDFLNNPPAEMVPGGVISQQLLNSLLTKMIWQMMEQWNLPLSEDFLFLARTKLKQTIAKFRGKRLDEARDRLVTSITREMLNQFLSLSLERLHHTRRRISKPPAHGKGMVSPMTVPPLQYSHPPSSASMAPLSFPYPQTVTSPSHLPSYSQFSASPYTSSHLSHLSSPSLCTGGTSLSTFLSTTSSPSVSALFSHTSPQIQSTSHLTNTTQSSVTSSQHTIVSSQPSDPFPLLSSPSSSSAHSLQSTHGVQLNNTSTQASTLAVAGTDGHGGQEVGGAVQVVEEVEAAVGEAGAAALPYGAVVGHLVNATGEAENDGTCVEEIDSENNDLMQDLAEADQSQDTGEPMEVERQDSRAEGAEAVQDLPRLSDGGALPKRRDQLVTALLPQDPPDGRSAVAQDGMDNVPEQVVIPPGSSKISGAGASNELTGLDEIPTKLQSAIGLGEMACTASFSSAVSSALGGGTGSRVQTDDELGPSLQGRPGKKNTATECSHLSSKR
ncbi:uncharacterized protein LOC143022115 isoform X4 [Oratosquilla oratoria]|uniref:uncharacterized protein LOC143022115 isoform X4 n=1 Tax=Oratosquilla oratoria TaxID=337810 RepID=UPI003F76A57C